MSNNPLQLSALTIWRGLMHHMAGALDWAKPDNFTQINHLLKEQARRLDAAQAFGLETELFPGRGIDFSAAFRAQGDSYYWEEYDTSGPELIGPCIFFPGRCDAPAESFTELAKLAAGLDPLRLAEAAKLLQKTTSYCDTFQLGDMRARGHMPLRLCLFRKNREIYTALAHAGFAPLFKRLELPAQKIAQTPLWQELARFYPGISAVDFDLVPGGGGKIGVEFSMAGSLNPAMQKNGGGWEELFILLAKYRLCEGEMIPDLLAWPGGKRLLVDADPFTPKTQPKLLRSISHVKLDFIGGEARKAKAYLHYAVE